MLDSDSYHPFFSNSYNNFGNKIRGGTERQAQTLKSPNYIFREKIEK